MDRSKFWQLIEAAKEDSSGECTKQANMLTDKLSQFAPEEMIEFQKTFTELMDQSYTWDLWAAAYIINGGCSDDCFDYFRAWLIGQGETVFTEAIRDPESLVNAGIDPEEPDVECENLMGVAEYAYEVKTGNEMSPALYMPTSMRTEPSGVQLDEDTMYDKYPKLAAKFG